MLHLRDVAQHGKLCMPLTAMNSWRRLLVRLDAIVWRWPWFRSAAYFLFLIWGKAFRIAYNVLASFWSGFLVFALLAVWRLSLSCPGCSIDAIAEQLTIYFALETLACYSILWICLASYFSRRKIAILESVNRAGEEFNGLNRGLAAEIGARLSELKELHSSKDTPRRPAVEPPGKAAVEVARGAGLVAPPIVRFDSGSTLSLAETTGEKSSMKVYGIELPLGSLLRLFHGLFMPSTRLSSSVHWHGECLIIIAGIDSEGLIWRAERELTPGATSEQRASAFAAAREEIVYHIFTDLSSVESSEWVAVQEFSEGLLAYRRTLNSDMNKVLNLHKAEEHFFKAISADKNFSRCRYNLGVVYRELEASYGYAQSKHTRGYRQAAIASFMQTLDDNPKDVDAAYALAIICREKRENYAKSIEFAERAIAQMPTHAQAWNLRGHVLRLMQEDPESKEGWQSSLRSRELAAAFAWRDLCFAAGKGQADLFETAKTEIVAPFTNLATALDKVGEHTRLKKALHQALCKNRDQHLHFALGKNLFEQKEYKKAIFEFKQAISLAKTLKDRALYYAYMADVAQEARIHKPKAADSISAILGPSFDLFREAMTSPSTTDNETRTVLAKACPDQSNTVELVTRVLKLKREASEDTVAGGAAMGTRLERINAERNKLCPSNGDRFTLWACAFLDIELADSLIPEDPSTEPAPSRANPSVSRARRSAIDLLEKAIKSVEREFPAEERLRFAYERLAAAHRQEGEINQARTFAEMAVAQSPFSAAASRQLGLVHYLSADFDRSEQELQKSFALNPFSGQTLREIGELSRGRADIAATRKERTDEFEKAIKKFHQALSLDDEKTDGNFLNHWLARFYGDICEYEKARKHYAIAIKNNGYILESNFYSGWTAFEQEKYPSAEHFFRETLKILRGEWNAEKKAEAEVDAKVEILDIKYKSGGKVQINTEKLEDRKLLREILRRSDDRTLTGPDETRGYIALRTGAFMAVVVAERYDKFELAKRIIRIVMGNLDVLGDPSANDNDKMSDRLRDKRQELRAVCTSYHGWICHRAEAHQDARKYLKESLKIRQMEETICHLAELDLEYGRLDKAQERCDQARQIDIRGWCESRIKRIETKIARIEAMNGAASRVA